MENPIQKVTTLISSACAQYPGGLKAVFLAIQQKGGKKRQLSTFYADFNPNESSLGNLKVGDFIAALEITGNFSALNYLAAYFGFSLMALNSYEPDAPTTEAEMLQDYPAVVEFHKAISEYAAKQNSYESVLAMLERATSELRQTAVKARG